MWIKMRKSVKLVYEGIYLNVSANTVDQNQDPLNIYAVNSLILDVYCQAFVRY